MKTKHDPPTWSYRSMTKAEQRRFVRELVASVTGRIMTEITADKIPKSWNGHELRMLVSERFASEGRYSQIASEPHHKRALAYRNTCIIQNL